VEVNAHSIRRAVFSVVCTMHVDTERCRENISAALSQHATIEEEVFSVGAVQRLYNDLNFLGRRP
jgi:DNA-binding transcriptional regulator/RsmH inhibitor MraZ